MDPVKALSLKVHSYLKDIRDLINKHNAGGGGDTNNSTAGIIDNAIRSDIYRRLTLLYSIFTSDNHSITPELAKIKNAILDAKREMRATKEDIKRARIVMPRKNPLDQFHSYLKLHGPVVRVHVLSYLTDPQDQLNMIEAVPSEGQLMHWNREKIKLELVFRIMMKRGSYFDNRNPLGMIYAFCRASQVHQSIVERYIVSKGLLWPNAIFHSHLMRELEVRQDVDSDSFLPTEVSFNICLDGSHYSTLLIDQQISLLRRIGHRIWICSIWLSKTSSSPLQILQVLSNFLSLMPKVKVLKLHPIHGAIINTGALTAEEVDREKKRIENFQLPECPSLRVFAVDGHSSITLTLTIAPILAKYAVGLRHLHIDNTIEDTDIAEIHSPNLVVLNVWSQRGMSGIPQYLRMFPNAPLKDLKVTVPEENSGVNFSNVLSFVSRQYGDTLEELRLHNLSCPDLAASSLLESSWMLEASFPKVKRLYLSYDYRQQVYGLTFLMLFPALEELHFSNDFEGTTDGFFGTDRNLELSLTRQDMLKSVIWKLFPKLSSIEFGGHGNDLTVKIRVTRKDCVGAQQNME